MSYLPHKARAASHLFSSFREIPSTVRMADNPAYDGETMKDKEKLEPHGNFDVPGEKGGGGTAGFLSVGNPPISLNACTQNSD